MNHVRNYQEYKDLNVLFEEQNQNSGGLKKTRNYDKLCKYLSYSWKSPLGNDILDWYDSLVGADIIKANDMCRDLLVLSEPEYLKKYNISEEYNNKRTHVSDTRTRFETEQDFLAGHICEGAVIYDFVNTKGKNGGFANLSYNGKAIEMNPFSEKKATHAEDLKYVSVDGTEVLIECKVNYGKSLDQIFRDGGAKYLKDRGGVAIVVFPWIKDVHGKWGTAGVFDFTDELDITYGVESSFELEDGTKKLTDVLHIKNEDLFGYRMGSGNAKDAANKIEMICRKRTRTE